MCAPTDRCAAPALVCEDAEEAASHVAYRVPPRTRLPFFPSATLPVHVQGSKYDVKPRNILFHVMKKDTEAEFWPRLLKDKVKVRASKPSCHCPLVAHTRARTMSACKPIACSRTRTNVFCNCLGLSCAGEEPGSD